MPEEIEVRRRRAVYRAHHRGTKEMDWLLGRFADNAVNEMDDPELLAFEQFLALPDPELQLWLMDTPPLRPSASPDPRFADLIDRIRIFHGLSALSAASVD